MSTERKDKLVTLEAELWERVRRYRFANEINTEVEAIRQLLELGLRLADVQSKKDKAA